MSTGGQDLPHPNSSHVHLNESMFMTPELRPNVVVPASARAVQSSMPATLLGARAAERRGANQISTALASMQINSAQLSSCETSDSGTPRLSLEASGPASVGNLLITT
jgi:hypothetical protein